MSKKSTMAIIRRSKVLRKTLNLLTTSERLAGDLAFHLAEIESDFKDFKTSLARLSTGKVLKKVDNPDISKLVGIIICHWPYHLKEAKRLLRQLGEEIEEKEKAKNPRKFEMRQKKMRKRMEAAVKRGEKYLAKWERNAKKHKKAKKRKK